jgi:hypothetical protein
VRSATCRGTPFGWLTTHCPLTFRPLRLRSRTGASRLHLPAGLRHRPDCHETWTPGIPAVVAPEVDYTAKDYLAFRRVLKDRFAITQPDWTGDEPADVRTTLLELLRLRRRPAQLHPGRRSNRGLLGTARRRISVRRHSLLVDYGMHDGCTARAWVRLCVKAYRCGARPSSRGSGSVGHRPGRPKLRRCDGLRRRCGTASVRRAGLEIVAAPKDLYPEHNAIDFYT